MAANFLAGYIEPMAGSDGSLPDGCQRCLGGRAGLGE
jgi:hypothetical protein